MAGHIQDRWYKTETGPDGKSVRVKTDRYGSGMRYRARYVGPDGTEKSKSFPDRQRRLAESWLAQVKADMERGQYIDPTAARTTFREYAERWLASTAAEVGQRDSLERRLRLHVYRHIGAQPLGSFQPEHIRTLLERMKNTAPAESHRRNIFAAVTAVFSAAVDDRLIGRNPCATRSVRAPKPSPTRVTPWAAATVFAVQAELPARFRAMVDVGGGCGLRQGEIFGLSVDELDFEGKWVAVRHQVKRVRGKLIFAPPKRGKLRDVPLPASVAARLRAHSERFPSVKVTLPWMTVDGPLITKELIFTGNTRDTVRASPFDDWVWKPALAGAGIITRPEPGKRYPAAREHGMHALRHFYASVLLDAGETIKALSTYLGHSDPGFTLRVYTHLMPSSEGRTRKAVDNVLSPPPEQPDGPQTAQDA